MTTRLFQIIIFSITLLLTKWFYRDANIFLVLGIGIFAAFAVRWLYYGENEHHKEKVLLNFVGERNIEKNQPKGYQMFNGNFTDVNEGALHTIEIYKNQLLPILDKSDYNVVYREGPTEDERGYCEQIAMKNNSFVFRINIFANGELDIFAKSNNTGVIMKANAKSDEYGKRQAFFTRVIEAIENNEETF